MKKVFFLLNKLAEYNFYDLINKYLPDVSVSIGESLPQHTEDYNLVVLWNYRKIITNTQNKKNIIIFHSSDLPKGRGWAPIYYTIANGLPYYIISGILAGEGVDTGDLIVKAKFRLRDNYTAEIIREWDNEISIMLVKEILSKFEGREICGIKQVGEAVYYTRRKPEDSEIPIEATLSDVLNHLKACEKNHPAFFYYNQTKFIIYLSPEPKPNFPKDLNVTFFEASL